MQVSYKKLWKLLIEVISKPPCTNGSGRGRHGGRPSQGFEITSIDKDMNKTDLRKVTGICSSTIAKMVKGEDVTVSILLRICKMFVCDIGDIAEFMPETEKV